MRPSSGPRVSCARERPWRKAAAHWPSLPEDDVSHGGFEIPVVDDRERGQVERSEHRRPDPTHNRDGGSEHESGDRGLFGAGEPWERIVPQCGASQQRRPRGDQTGFKKRAAALGGEDPLPPVLVLELQAAPRGFGEDVYTGFGRVVGEHEA